MHIVTISSSFASTFDMLFTLCIQKISDWRELSLYLFTVKESSIRIFLSILSVIFLTIFNIHISHNMICEIVHYYHILNLSIFHHSFKYLFIKILRFCHSSISICSADIVTINQSSLNCIIFIHAW